MVPGESGGEIIDRVVDTVPSVLRSQCLVVSGKGKTMDISMHGVESHACCVWLHTSSGREFQKKYFRGVFLKKSAKNDRANCTNKCSQVAAWTVALAPVGFD
jgi:hypothetical protein